MAEGFPALRSNLLSPVLSYRCGARSILWQPRALCLTRPKAMTAPETEAGGWQKLREADSTRA